MKNLKTALLLNIPHVECCNRKFTLYMKDMIEKTKSLDNTTNDIKNIMIQAKELKNNTILRPLINWKSKYQNERRWSKMCKMLQKWMCIRSELMEASLHQDSNIEIKDGTIETNREMDERNGY